MNKGVSKSVGEITNSIVKLEGENELFKWDIDGVFVWEIIRYKIYAKAVAENAEKKVSTGISFLTALSQGLVKLKTRISKYVNAIIYNPYFDLKKVDVIIFESSRKLLFNNTYIDPYTKFLNDELVAEGNSIAVYQSSFSFDRLAKKDNNTKHLDLVYLFSSFKNKISFFKFTKEQLERINFIEALFYNEFKIAFNFSELIANEIKLFKSNSIFFDNLFKKKNPKKIFLTNFCDKPALIAMAKKNKIPVIDIQHGLISSKDIIYNYPGVLEGSLHYFPDIFYAWSKIWEKTSKIPLLSKDIIDYGNKYLENQKNNYSNIVKREDLLLVISQPGLTKQIAKKLSENNRDFKYTKIIYKLHPIEYDYAYNYPEIKSLMDIENISFAKKSEDLYQLLAEAGTVLGVYSTALIEALSFNCRVLLLDLPGVEMMSPFINDGLAKMYAPVLKTT